MIGFGEIIMVAVVACVILKPGDLPKVLTFIKQAKAALHNLKQSCDNDINAMYVNLNDGQSADQKSGQESDPDSDPAIEPYYRYNKNNEYIIKHQSPDCESATESTTTSTVESAVESDKDVL